MHNQSNAYSHQNQSNAYHHIVKQGPSSGRKLWFYLENVNVLYHELEIASKPDAAEFGVADVAV